MSDDALEVQRSLGRLEGKLDSLIMALAERDLKEEARRKEEAVEKEQMKQRIHSLETSRSRIYFTAAGASAVVAGLFQAARLWLYGHKGP